MRRYTWQSFITAAQRITRRYSDTRLIGTALGTSKEGLGREEKIVVMVITPNPAAPGTCSAPERAAASARFA